MKFEMNRAWNSALALLAANRQVVSIVAGVFFFLPYVLFMMAIPDVGAAALSNPDNIDAAYARIGEFYGRFWWIMLILALVQSVGMLGILALLTDYRRPTVGEALAIGARKVLPYLGAYLLVGLGVALFFTLLATLAAVGGAGVIAGIAVLVMIPVLFYLMVKFSLVPAVLVKEGVSNPVVALRRSWQLTRGNSFRLFGFYFLLMLVLLVLTMVISMLVGLLVVAFGPGAGVFSNALVSALLNAIWATGFLAIISAIHDQLGGTSSGEIAETFE